MTCPVVQHSRTLFHCPIQFHLQSRTLPGPRRLSRLPHCSLATTCASSRGARGCPRHWSPQHLCARPRRRLPLPPEPPGVRRPFQKNYRGGSRGSTWCAQPRRTICIAMRVHRRGRLSRTRSHNNGKTGQQPPPDHLPAADGSGPSFGAMHVDGM